MRRNAASTDKHIIKYEYKVGSKWVEQTIKLTASVRLGSVLKEMRSQTGLIRNVSLIQSA